jgi:pimeloyl-ACP methyl ester carboxylesterase
MRWAPRALAVLLFCTSHQCLGQAVADSGSMVKVNNRRVHVLVAGKGPPTVVFEAGFVNDLRSWAKVQPEVAKFCTTVSYDRPGLGLSEESSSARTGEQIASDLHALLQKLGLNPPYVLAGHSAGGLYIRSFAHRYPNEIGGMIFVDAVLPEYLRWLQRKDHEHWRELEKIGMESGSVVRAQWLGLEPTMKEIEKSEPLPRVPVVVLVSNQSDLPFKPLTAMPEFSRTQRRFANHMPGAKMKVIAAGHELPSLAPEDVTAAILSVVRTESRNLP